MAQGCCCFAVWPFPCIVSWPLNLMGPPAKTETRKWLAYLRKQKQRKAAERRDAAAQKARKLLKHELAALRARAANAEARARRLESANARLTTANAKWVEQIAKQRKVLNAKAATAVAALDTVLLEKKTAEEQAAKHADDIKRLRTRLCWWETWWSSLPRRLASKCRAWRAPPPKARRPELPSDCVAGAGWS